MRRRLRHEAAALAIDRADHRLGIVADVAQRVVDHVQAFDHLGHRFQPRVAQDLGQPEHAHALHGHAGILPPQLEEHADHRQDVLDLLQHRLRVARRQLGQMTRLCRMRLLFRRRREQVGDIVARSSGAPPAAPRGFVLPSG